MLVVKNSSPNSEDPKDLDWIPGSGRFPGEGKDTPLQYSCLGNPMDRGTYDWGHKELDTTEQLRFFFFFFFWYVCNWFTLLYSRNEHIVNKLYSHKDTKILFKKNLFSFLFLLSFLTSQGFLNWLLNVMFPPVRRSPFPQGDCRSSQVPRMSPQLNTNGL